MKRAMTVNCLTEQPRHGGVHGDFHVTRKKSKIKHMKRAMTVNCLTEG